MAMQLHQLFLKVKDMGTDTQNYHNIAANQTPLTRWCHSVMVDRIIRTSNLARQSQYNVSIHNFVRYFFLDNTIILEIAF